MRFISRICMAFAVAMMLGSAALAQSILTVQVKQAGQAAKTIQFSPEDLRALGLFELETSNDYLDEMALFEGVLMRDLIAAVDAGNTKIARLFAENDYVVEVSTQEFLIYDVMLALKQNGVALSLRDKGPIWMIYPTSDFPELQDPSFNNRLIWQLVRVEFE